jgi:hypothetical protein
MQKEIKFVDKQKGVVRITSISERWYAKPGEDKSTGLPVYEYFPSSTWIASYYPKGIGFYKWLADKGWDDAEALKVSAGNRGSKVHKACEILEKDGHLSIDTCFQNNETEVMEALSTEELDCIQSFARWHNEAKPQLLANEMTVFGGFYAGTLDRIYRIGGQIYVVDLKTSQNIWEEMKIQIASYSHAHIDYKELGITEAEWNERKLAVLQLGYRLNKAHFKFTEIEDKWELFQTAHQIWKNENQNGKPKEIEIPLVITITKTEVSSGQPTVKGLGKEKQQISKT